MRPQRMVIVKHPDCPVCGERVEGWEYNPTFIEDPEMAPAWAGGPLIPTYELMPRLVRVRTWTDFRALPCGHFIPDHSLVFIALPAVVGSRVERCKRLLHGRGRRS